jgi:hypothetical protein
MLNISRQAYIFTIIALVTSLINIITGGFMFGMNGVFAYIILFVILIPFLLLMIYNLDCLSTGHCEIWSWVLSVLAIVYMIYMSILMIYVAAVRPDEKDKKIL